MMRKHFGYGTYLDLDPVYHNTYGGAALCSDNKVRKLKRVGVPDTFFSMPASVRVKGKTVSGYITTDTRDGFSTESPTDLMMVRFRAYNYGKNAYLLPNIDLR